MIALDQLFRFVEQHPDDGAALTALGASLNASGRYGEAAIYLDRALALGPGHSAALIERGLAAEGQGDKPLAEALWSEGMAIDQQEAAFPLNLGRLAEQAGEIAAARTFYAAAATLAPALAAPLIALAGMARAEGDPLAAIKLLDRAIALDEAAAAAWVLRCRALKDLNRGDEAVAAGRRALALAPDAPAARLNLAYALLMTGQIVEGFALYEARFQADPANCPDRSGGLPAWDGGPIGARSLHVWREQGVGDEIFFLTKLPDLIAAAGPARLSWAADPRLVPLFARSFPDMTFLPGDQLPAAAMQVAAGSLPHRLNGPPGRHGQLIADWVRCDQFRRQLQTMGPPPFLGLCWRGLRRGSGRDPHYTTPVDWLPLARNWPGTLVSLQYGADGEEAAPLQASARAFVILDDLDLKDDLDGTAALIAALDGVISVDSATAPLASFLGKPTWWAVIGGRWPMLGKSQSPWFPAAHTVEKPLDAAWDDCVARITATVVQTIGAPR